MLRLLEALEFSARACNEEKNVARRILCRRRKSFKRFFHILEIHRVLLFNSQSVEEIANLCNNLFAREALDQINVGADKADAHRRLRIVVQLSIKYFMFFITLQKEQRELYGILIYQAAGIPSTTVTRAFASNRPQDPSSLGRSIQKSIALEKLGSLIYQNHLRYWYESANLGKGQSSLDSYCFSNKLEHFLLNMQSIKQMFTQINPSCLQSWSIGSKMVAFNDL